MKVSKVQLGRFTIIEWRPRHQSVSRYLLLQHFYHVLIYLWKNGGLLPQAPFVSIVVCPIQFFFLYYNSLMPHFFHFREYLSFSWVFKSFGAYDDSTKSKHFHILIALIYQSHLYRCFHINIFNFWRSWIHCSFYS